MPLPVKAYAVISRKRAEHEEFIRLRMRKTRRERELKKNIEYLEMKLEAAEDKIAELESERKKARRNPKPEKLQSELKLFKKKLEKAENKIGQLEDIQRNLKNEKKRSEAVFAKMDTRQVGKIKEELNSLKKISEDQKKTTENQNILIASLKERISSQENVISDLKKENRRKTQLMEYGFAGDMSQSRQVALKKLEMEKLQKELTSEIIKDENHKNLELFLASNAKKKDKIAAKKYYEKQMLEKEVIMRKVRENLNKIEKFYSFSTSQLVNVTNNEVFTESTRRSIDHLLKYNGSDSALDSAVSVDDEECPICIEPILGSVDNLEKCPQCKKESHTTCIGEWLEKEGTCPFCRHVILKTTRGGARR